MMTGAFLGTKEKGGVDSNQLNIINPFLKTVYILFLFFMLYQIVVVYSVIILIYTKKRQISVIMCVLSFIFCIC